jgi:hypothetical protein
VQVLRNGSLTLHPDVTVASLSSDNQIAGGITDAPNVKHRRKWNRIIKNAVVFLNNVAGHLL